MVLLNPRAPALWQSHVILNGRSRDYHVRDFAGPLSIKSVLTGSATWATSEGQFEILPGSCLVVNDGQPYSLTVESRQVVETLCIFFRRGFVEDVARSMSRPDDALLADPWNAPAIEFGERLHVDGRPLTPLLRALQLEPDEALVWRLAERLLQQHRETRDRASRLPAAKAATRAELARRVERGRNAMEGTLAELLDLQHVAREAALSPYHFHRAFTQLLGETPHAYLTRRRMERARQMLTSTGMPVLDICLACGYQSLGSFTSLFRKHAGVPPAQFRRARK